MTPCHDHELPAAQLGLLRMAVIFIDFLPLPSPTMKIYVWLSVAKSVEAGETHSESPP